MTQHHNDVIFSLQQDIRELELIIVKKRIHISMMQRECAHTSEHVEKHVHDDGVGTYHHCHCLSCDARWNEDYLTKFLE